VKQFIIFDLEATCWDKSEGNNQINEIIEIGAVKLDENAKQIDTHQTFIRPTKNPILSEFCIGLTSIKQDDVDSAPYFAEAIHNFENWISDNNSDTALISWGYYDKNQLLKECASKNYHGEIINLLDNHFSLKHDFAKMKGIKACGMKRALEILKIPLDGTHHRGIDDALNISKIFKTIFNQWNIEREFKKNF